VMTRISTGSVLFVIDIKIPLNKRQNF